ncbi:hypothetical protein H310_12038 [Aphanomyces invadans]|uniref:Uncharacterized protein n=1 Tax=Aphanomyces invadans TaxID=157072 RepID=A0A024TKB2_9STRA|nr:hypothetical protein H310_12038 [Aphanomyces invadans]ETV94409.1 hypothetical protein H310_12038 [Aphanomyces invadans]RHY28769.1 hypothetical protein DYB32_005722 [Aphanomyces invadans]|eukprot:XP_008877171.1 hypothetical protein H310_12038 [Aphanomyces invadans]
MHQPQIPQATALYSPVEAVESPNHDTAHVTEGTGTWTPDEHERFLAGIAMYPKGPWKKVAVIVKTRSVRQLRTHAQKYREKLARRERRVDGGSVSSACSDTCDGVGKVDWDHHAPTHEWGTVEPIAFGRNSVQYDECALFLLEAFGEWGVAL